MTGIYLIYMGCTYILNLIHQSHIQDDSHVLQKTTLTIVPPWLRIFANNSCVLISLIVLDMRLMSQI
jgi:hypothetical protein